MAVFGSRRTSLVMPNSDWDLVIFGATPAGYTARHALAREINHRDLSSYMEVIDKARVPIVKMRDKISGLAFDICFDVDSGPISSAYVKKYGGC